MRRGKFVRFPARDDAREKPRDAFVGAFYVVSDLLGEACAFRSVFGFRWIFFRSGTSTPVECLTPYSRGMGCALTVDCRQEDGVGEIRPHSSVGEHLWPGTNPREMHRTELDGLKVRQWYSEVRIVILSGACRRMRFWTRCSRGIRDGRVRRRWLGRWWSRRIRDRPTARTPRNVRRADRLELLWERSLGRLWGCFYQLDCRQAEW